MALELQIEGMKQEMAKSGSEKGQIESLNERIDELSDQLQAANSDRNGKMIKIDELKNQIEFLELNIKKQQNENDRVVRQLEGKNQEMKETV